MAITGRGPAPVFARAYNSNDPRIGPLGPGWTHSYNVRVVRRGAGNGDVYLVGPDGRTDRYLPAGGGAYTPPDGVFTALTRNSNGTGGVRQGAPGPGRLSSRRTVPAVAAAHRGERGAQPAHLE